VAAIPDDRIVPDPTDFWALSATGPCGPDTEIHFDRGAEFGCGRPDCDPTCSCSRFTELWNLVFQTYNRTEQGQLEPLPKPGIDTGMGFERVAAVLQGAPSIFETDLLAPIVSAVQELRGGHRHARPTGVDEGYRLAVKVIAEHTRALAFLLADGFTPSNEGAGYVVRRVLRRAYRFGRTLGLEEPFLYRLVPSVIGTVGDVYPELRTTQERITSWVQQEEKQFEETLERSYAPLMAVIERAKQAGSKLLAGEDVFKLYDTYGMPKELAAEIAAENGLELDEVGFARAMEEQRQRGRAHVEQEFAPEVRAGYHGFVGRTEFVGYEATTAPGVVVGILRGGEAVESLKSGEEGEVFLDRTPFYGEAGGQVGDRGTFVGRARLSMPAGCEVAADVLDTCYPVEGAHAHRVRVQQGEVRVGEEVEAVVDRPRRQAIARAHTATHLLHYALRQVLGPHALQSGSLVEADRLRFDFAHFAALTPEERQRIEDEVNRLVLEDDVLGVRQTSIEEARAQGAVALFGEKYGEVVRLVQVGDYSKELCGGTHLARTAAIGLFTITSEGSIGSGLRRIEAVTGREAQALVVRQREMLLAAAHTLGAQPEKVIERAEAVQAELRRAQREIERLQQRSAGALAGDLVKTAVEVNGVKLLTARVELAPEALRNLADDLVRRLGSGIVVLGSEFEGRAQFVSEVSQDLIPAGFHAGNLIREVAKVAGGGGGGRPDFAQAGGKNPERLDEALAKARELVAARTR
jgi:alanyl-tRNA synthetase